MKTTEHNTGDEVSARVESRVRPKLLVIDDDADVLESCQRLFSRKGFDVRTTTSGREGIELATHATFDVVLCDRRIPDLDGAQVISVIHKWSADSAIVMISGFPAEYRDDEATELGAFGYLAKPFTPEQALRAVRDAIAGKSLKIGLAEMSQPNMQGRVLVVDDDQDVLDSIERILRGQGYLVDLASSAGKGLMWALNREYELVLSDVRMPDMDGIDMLRDIKRSKPSLPVVMLTGYATIESAVQATKLGAYDYLEKPFAPDDLLLVLGAAIRQTDSRDRQGRGQQAETFIERMTTQARIAPRRLVLPEGTDERTVMAARILTDLKLASSVTLIGRPEEIERVADKTRTRLDGIQLLLPQESEHLKEYARVYQELLRHSAASPVDAMQAVTDPLRWGAVMLKKGAVDAMVVGAQNTTSRVLKTVLSLVGTRWGTTVASSCFVLRLPSSLWGSEGHLVLADCAVNPAPGPKQLSEIALAASDFCRTVVGVEPIVAFLSFSTKSSAQHPLAERVHQATELARKGRPDLIVDGELQVDAAIVPSVAAIKAPQSPVGGRANVLVFPDLNSGNIGYKLLQRFAGAETYGPFLLGLARPVSDLSRGCRVEDIVNTAVVTLVQAGQPVVDSEVQAPFAASGRERSRIIGG